MIPFSRGKEEEVRTKVALMIAMVVLVALVGHGSGPNDRRRDPMSDHALRCHRSPPGAL